MIVATLCIQLYWNYKNYQVGKQQLINDVQTSLDNAVDGYYTQLAKTNSFGWFRENMPPPPDHKHDTTNVLTDSMHIKRKNGKRMFDMRIKNIPERYERFKSHNGDSTNISLTIIDTIVPNIEKAAFMGLLDSIRNPVESLSSRIIISFTEDTLSLKKIDSLLLSELMRKNIDIDYGLTHKGFLQQSTTLRPEIIEKARLSTSTKSPYFFYDNSLTIHFSNITLAVLKKNLLGVLLSFLLVAGVVACLLYLLQVIKKQKQLSEVKNDLISNITHEFKTPIATIGVAMEAISSFQEEKVSEQTRRYAEISTEQVQKLNVMVEKLLETASLDSEQLELNLESNNLVELLRSAVASEAITTAEKKIEFNTSDEDIPYFIDVFHFENAINNIMDNAIKYGGDKIKVSIQQKPKEVEIDISDSGNSLTEANKKQIFEKFYRIPKGNTHDVKGFGIGLYYTKKIIEKHKGSISLSTNGHTTFRITLPNG